MTEQPQNSSAATADKEQRPEGESQLSTADLASAANQRDQPQDQAGGPTDAGSHASGGAEATSLFSPDEAEQFRSRWNSIQTGFVDDPRRTVEQADGLVAEVIKRLAEVFAGERSTLENQWETQGDTQAVPGDSASTNTEALRVAVQRYRSFFDRLLSV